MKPTDEEVVTWRERGYQFCANCYYPKPLTMFRYETKTANKHPDWCRACIKPSLLTPCQPLCKECGKPCGGQRCKDCYLLNARRKRDADAQLEPIRSLDRQILETAKLINRLNAILKEHEM